MEQNEILDVNTKQQPPSISRYRLPPPPPQTCPRCYSTTTKFCYYNNYSLAQPRYFCKACRRYWTQGGTLRNVPIGGGTRKSKQQKTLPSNHISTSQPHNYPGLDLSRVYKGLSNTIIPQMAGVQSLATGNNQVAALSLHSSCGQLGASVAQFQGMNISSFNQSLIPPRPLSSWIINSGPAAGQFSFWSGAANINGGAQAGSSLNPYRRWETDYNKP